jgi:hypothetical protein
MRPLATLAVLSSLATMACAGAAGDTASTMTGAVAADVPPSVPVEVTQSNPRPQGAGLCDSTTTTDLGRVANTALDEASGLVASRRHSGVLWSHNDGGSRPGVFAIAQDGSDLGFHPLDVEGATDIEDMAMVAGPSGDDLLLADIGDNGAERESIRMYRFAEPDPGTPAAITDVEVLEFVYPDRPHNAEVLLVDAANDRIVIVTKEQDPADGRRPELAPTQPSFVFEGPLSGHGSGAVPLTPAGMLDTLALERRTDASTQHLTTLLGIGGLPTGGDVNADGSLIAIRTYATIWLWSRDDGRTVAESLAADPCQVRIVAAGQGEAVAFVGDTLVALAEGVNQPLQQISPEG